MMKVPDSKIRQLHLPRNMDKKIMIWGIVLLILLNGVLGIGVRPARTVVDFSPNLESDHSFRVINNDEMDFEVNVYVEGELEEYIKLEEKKMFFKSDEDSKKINFKLKLPDKMPSGEVKGNIVVEEILGSNELPYQFAARVVLKHKIIVTSPYPTKFVEGKIEIEDRGNDLGLVAEVNNLGSKSVEKIITKFYVNDRLEEIDNLETEEGSLEVGEVKRMEVEIPKKKVEYGEFDILAAIVYDDYKLELEKKLVVGDPEIEILYFDKYFVSGKINKFTVDLLNKWNQKIEKVLVDVLVFKEGKEIDRIKTEALDIEGGEMEKVEGYFDATDKEMGDYEFDVVVDYNGKKTHEKFSGKILEEEEYKEATESSGVLTYVLIGILFGLIVIIIGILIIRQRNLNVE